MTPPPTGKLLDAPVVLATMTTAQIDAVTSSQGIQALTGRAVCDVEIVSLNYSTPGPKAESSNASGVLLMPVGGCQTSAAPLVAHARGTEVLKTKTLADAQNPETVFMAAMYASHGYAVVATDYLGFAKSPSPTIPTCMQTRRRGQSLIRSARGVKPWALSAANSPAKSC